MTSQSLLLWIVTGIVLQVGIYLGIAFWRHWQDYQGLRRQTSESGLVPTQVAHEDVRTKLPAAWAGLRSFKVSRKCIEDAAQSICSFYLTPEDGQPLPPFMPGQFLTFSLEVPTATGDVEAITRCYSLSDAPTAESYRISVKRVPAPAASDVPPGRSSKHLHDHVAEGSVLQVRAPAGHFYLEPGESPVVLVGGGIGITPMLSMLNCSLAQQPAREIWLFYGVRNGREVVMRAQLEALAAAHPNFHLHFCFSDPLPEELAGRDFQHRGRIDLGLLRLQLPLKPYHFYICGPTPMMESLVGALDDWGVPAARIHYEAFGPASVKRRTSSSKTASAETVSEIVVSFARSGQQLTWNPAAGSLLEFAEAHGVAVESGCRAGSCGSCQTTIKAGEVSYRHAPDFDPEPGSCLLCVCTPKTNVVLEA